MAKFETQQDFELFQQAMQHFQNGGWHEGMSLLEGLIESDPLNSELRSLKAEMELRARIDEQEILDTQFIRKQKLLVIASRAGLALAILLLVSVIISVSSHDLRESANEVRQNMLASISDTRHDTQVKNARNLLNNDQYQLARQLLLEVQAEDPGYPGLDDYLREADEIEMYDEIYLRADTAYVLGDYQGAYDLYKQVATWRKDYRGAASKLEEIEKIIAQSNMFKEAETAFADGDFQAAIPLYEQLQSLDTEYERSIVEEHLFESYLKAAEGIISQDTESLEALAAAEIFFKKALSLRPQDEQTQNLRDKARKAFEVRLANSYVDQAQKSLVEKGDSLDALQTAQALLAKAVALVPDDQSVRSQYDLAAKYLQAIDSYESGGWDQVIEKLEDVIQVDPNYASYTAAQTLYEAYMARGRGSLAAGLFEAALTDLQRAVQISKLIPGAVTQEFEATRWIAEVYGLQGNYTDAVAVFRLAVDLSDFGLIIQQARPELTANLTQASALADGGKFKESFLAYRDLLRQSGDFYERISYTAVTGDYLPQIARKYNTTVQAILEANDIHSTTAINRQILIIPFFPLK